MTTVILGSVAFALGIGITVLWANPSRLMNQVLFAIWLTFALWFSMVHEAIRAEMLLSAATPANAALWLRLNSMVAALLPAQICLLKEVVGSGSEKIIENARRSMFFFCLSAVLLILTFADSFVLGERISGSYARGVAYWAFICIELFAYSWMLIATVLQMYAMKGIRRLELQLFTLTLVTACLAATVCVGLGTLLRSDPLRRSTFIVPLLSFAAIAWAMTAYRVFDIRQIIVLLGHRIGLVCLLAAATISSYTALHPFFRPWLSLLLSVTPALSLGLWLGRKSREWPRLTGEHLLVNMRRAAIELGRTEANPDELITGFQRLLQKQSTAMTVTLLFDNGSFYVGGDLKFAKERPAFIGLRDIGWATPESVQRRRSTTPLEDIREFMAQYSLGLVLTAPRRSASPSLIVAFGIKANEWPFTYPEIERLHNVTELIDNIITRSRLSAEAALKAKVEHLSIMSRGLAHDLKNLITPISSYLVHTDDRHAPGSVEHEVHAAARRSVRIMTDYIREALFFANELTAKFERVELRSIVDSAVDIARQRAERRGVTIAMSVDESLTLVVDAVLLQRLFVNLLANAVDASSVGSNVTLRASAGSPDRVQVEVIDEGCGIPMDVFSRIFEPYFTTKEFGEEVRGFGLGLTICQKIVNLHAGVIHVRSEIDVGTTITVELPVVPPTAMSSSGNSAGGSEAAHAAGGHSRTHPGTTHVDSAAPDRR